MVEEIRQMIETGSRMGEVGQPPTVVSPLRTLDEAAAYLRRPVQTLRYWRHVGKGPRSMKIGAAVMYRQSELDAFIDQQAAAAGAGAP